MSEPIFPYKKAPFEHQREALRRGASRPFFGYIMDPGTGKTKVTLDDAAWNYIRGTIRGLMVSAPSGIQTNWAQEEIPEHISDSVSYEVFEWDSGKAATKRFQREFDEFITRTKHSSVLAIFLINIEAIITDNGRKAIKSFLTSRPCMMAIDESVDIKSPGSKRTLAIKALGKLARLRRILSGLPAPESPVDWYAQLSFLSPHIVGSNVASFKGEYCIFEQRFYRGPDKPSTPVITGYRNLDKLNRIIDEHCFRVSKDVLKLPPKLWSKWRFDMSPEQRRMYMELKEEWLTRFADGEEVTAALTIVRLLRLQQIASGYVPPDNLEDEDDEPLRDIPGDNPRMDALLEITEKYPGDMIIWTRYIRDVDKIMAALGDQAVRYDGQVGKDERLESIKRYTKGDARFFVSNPVAAGRGLTLINTTVSIYYSQYWGLDKRVQSEDRAHRIGLDHPVLYIDLIAKGTVDERIVKSLRDKDELARLVMGEPKREWI